MASRESRSRSSTQSARSSRKSVVFKTPPMTSRESRSRSSKQPAGPSRKSVVFKTPLMTLRESQSRSPLQSARSSRKSVVFKTPPMTSRESRNRSSAQPVRPRAEVTTSSVALRESRSRSSTQPSRVSGTRQSVQLKVPKNFDKPPGIVYTVGQGDVGQLGLSDAVLEINQFTRVKNLSDPIIQVAAGGMHTVCLSLSGKVWTFGCNDEGALGRVVIDDLDTFTPEKVTLDGKVVSVSAGDSHSAALMEDGRVFIWGLFRDSLGVMRKSSDILETYMDLVPRVVEVSEPVVRLASGAHHILLLTSSGKVYSAGCAEQGQLGRLSKRSATRESRFGLIPLLKPTAIYIKGCKFFVDIWATQYGSFVKEKEKGIFAFGLNNYGQLGLPINGNFAVFYPINSPPLSNVNHEWIKIAGGDHHTILLNKQGKLHSLGRQEYGRLGLGKNSGDATVPSLITSLSSQKIVDIGCGTVVSYAVSHNGDAFAWGFGSNGQLGCDENDNDVWVPKKIICKDLIESNRRVLHIDGGGQHGVLLATGNRPGRRTRSQLM